MFKATIFLIIFGSFLLFCVDFFYAKDYEKMKNMREDIKC